MKSRREFHQSEGLYENSRGVEERSDDTPGQREHFRRSLKDCSFAPDFVQSFGLLTTWSRPLSGGVVASLLHRPAIDVKAFGLGIHAKEWRWDLKRDGR